MQVPEFCDSFAKRDVEVAFDLECLFDEKDLGIRAEIFMAFAETIPDVVAGFKVRDDIVIRGGDMFQEETTEGTIIVGPDPVGIRVDGLVGAFEGSI